jgi:hypothetical protein
MTYYYYYSHPTQPNPTQPNQGSAMQEHYVLRVALKGKNKGELTES